MPEVDPSQRPQAILAGLPLEPTSVAAIAQHLDLNKVPNALWGNFLLSIFGVPMIFNVRFSFPYLSLTLLIRHRVLTLLYRIVTSRLPGLFSAMQASRPV
jgi:hypothetical protein